MFNAIRYEVDSGIATIRLHRPERLNAFTVEMARELMGAFDLADADEAVRAVIVTGEGRAFCAGADLATGSGTFKHEGVMSDSRGAGVSRTAAPGAVVLAVTDWTGTTAPPAAP
jgi:enoyl-CoA hydratase/carnithine racemase